MLINKIKKIVFLDDNKKQVNTEDLFEITSEGLYYPLQIKDDIVQGFISKEKIKEILDAFSK